MWDTSSATDASSLQQRISWDEANTNSYHLRCVILNLFVVIGAFHCSLKPEYMCNAVGFCSFLLPIYTVCVNNSTHLVVLHQGLSTEDANTRQCFWLFPTCSNCLMMLQYPWHLNPLDPWLAVLSLSRTINLFTSLRVFNPNADLDTLI